MFVLNKGAHFPRAYASHAQSNQAGMPTMRGENVLGPSATYAKPSRSMTWKRLKSKKPVVWDKSVWACGEGDEEPLPSSLS